MTTLTIFKNNSIKGKHLVEVSDNTILSGIGIIKAKYVGNCNCYMITYSKIEILKKQYKYNEVSKW